MARIIKLICFFVAASCAIASPTAIAEDTNATTTTAPPTPPSSSTLSSETAEVSTATVTSEETSSSFTSTAFNTTTSGPTTATTITVTESTTTTTPSATTTTTITTPHPVVYTNVSLVTELWDLVLLYECRRVLKAKKNNTNKDDLFSSCNEDNVYGNHTCVVSFAVHSDAVIVADAANAGELPQVYSGTLIDPPTPQPQPQPQPEEENKPKTGVIVGVIIGVFVVAAIGAVAVYYYRKRRTQDDASVRLNTDEKNMS